VNTGNDMRDKDLRSPRFFNVTEHPRMTFTSTCVRQHGQQWIISGELSINDVTRPVDIDTEFLGVDDTGLQGETRIGFSGRTAIRRSEFGLDGLTGDGTKIIVGDVVALELDIEAVLNQ
jgi:polyisoprenoid-binding protein YceI